jgi:NAD+ diphosphatase
MKNTIIPFTGNPLDRASEKRLDSTWIESKRHDPTSLVLPLWRLEPFLLVSQYNDEPKALGLLQPSVLEALVPASATCVFLGLDKNQRAYFALDISTFEKPPQTGPFAGIGYFCEARAAAQLVSSDEGALIAQAKPMIDWHQRHGFCPRCGARTTIVDAGYRRLCSQCNSEHFPRVDPVVIMLAIHEDACLVGRGRQFPAGMFSALAGFVEPGETIEEAVRRELKEEASIEVGAVSYHATQPWPFPSSLMIGCFAHASSRQAKADEAELAEVRWLERSLARELISGRSIDGVRIPPPIAIAHHLIRAWALED